MISYILNPYFLVNVLYMITFITIALIARNTILNMIK